MRGLGAGLKMRCAGVDTTELSHDISDIDSISQGGLREPTEMKKASQFKDSSPLLLYLRGLLNEGEGEVLREWEIDEEIPS